MSTQHFWCLGRELYRFWRYLRHWKHTFIQGCQSQSQTQKYRNRKRRKWAKTIAIAEFCDCDIYRNRQKNNRTFLWIIANADFFAIVSDFCVFSAIFLQFFSIFSFILLWTLTMTSKLSFILNLRKYRFLQKI